MKSAKLTDQPDLLSRLRDYLSGSLMRTAEQLKADLQAQRLKLEQEAQAREQKRESELLAIRDLSYLGTSIGTFLDLGIPKGLLKHCFDKYRLPFPAIDQEPLKRPFPSDDSERARVPASPQLEHYANTWSELEEIEKQESVLSRERDETRIHLLNMQNRLAQLTDQAQKYHMEIEKQKQRVENAELGLKDVSNQLDKAISVRLQSEHDMTSATPLTEEGANTIAAEGEEPEVTDMIEVQIAGPTELIREQNEIPVDETPGQTPAETPQNTDDNDELMTPCTTEPHSAIGPTQRQWSPLSTFDWYRLKPLFLQGDYNRAYSPTYNSIFATDLNGSQFICQNESQGRLCDQDCGDIHFNDFVVPDQQILKHILKEHIDSATRKAFATKLRNNPDLDSREIIKLLIETDKEHC